jgi:tetratricopeptide (TPR) repeat protein
VSLRAAACAVALLLALAACTPQQMLLGAVIPDGTASVLLGHLEGVAGANRQRIIELERQGDWPGLARFADANIAVDPFSAEWRLVGGYAHAQLRDFRRAADYFGEMVRLAPDDAGGYEFLAEAQRAGGEPQRAVVTLERALRVVRESPRIHSLMGNAYADLGRDAAALAAYRRALALAPQMPEAWWGYGSTALRAGRLDEAREASRALQQMGSPLGAELERRITAGR